MSKYIKVDDLQKYCDNQKDHSITPNEFQRMTQYDFGWHTGTPTEDGEYLCVFKRDGRDDDIVYGWCTWDGVAWDVYLNAVDHIIYTIVAWQKITPYEEN